MTLTLASSSSSGVDGQLTNYAVKLPATRSHLAVQRDIDNHLSPDHSTFCSSEGHFRLLKNLKDTIDFYEKILLPLYLYPKVVSLNYCLYHNVLSIFYTIRHYWIYFF